MNVSASQPDSFTMVNTMAKVFDKKAVARKKQVYVEKPNPDSTTCKHVDTMVHGGDGGSVEAKLDLLSNKVDQLMELQQRVLNCVESMATDVKDLEAEVDFLKKRNKVPKQQPIENQNDYEEVCSLIGNLSLKSEKQGHKINSIEIMLEGLQQVVGFLGETFKNKRVRDIITKSLTMEAADAGDGAKDSQVNRTRSLKQAVSVKKHARREEGAEAKRYQSEKKSEISNGGMSMQCVEEISTSVKGTTAETEAMCGEADYRSEAKPSESVLLEEEALNDMDARECKDRNVDIQVEDKEQVEDLEEGVEVQEEAVDGEEEEEQEEEKSKQEEKHKEVNEDENNKKLDNDVENEIEMKDSASGSREDTETQSSHSPSKCPDNRPQSISTENAIMGVKAKEDCISEEDSNSNSSVLKQVEKPPVIDDSPTPPAPFTHRLVTINTSTISNFYSIGKEKVLGGGRFGQVYSCVEKDTGLPFAAKIIKARAAKEKEEVKNEIGIMNQLHHDNIIQLYAAFETRISFTLIVEHVAGGELFERIVSEDYNLTELDTIIFVRQICEAIAHMHQQYILHLDLKPENILCVNREGNQIKIIDFGLARRYKPREQLKVLFGTPEFLAPEVVNYDHVSFATDMWSLGIIAYMLVSGLSPFLGDDEPETLSNIVQGNWSFDDEAFEDISDEAKGFVSELLVKDKGGRMSALQCLKHPWLCNLSEKAKKLNVKLKSQVLLHSYMMRKRWRKNFFAVTAANRLRKITSCPMKLDSETPVAKSSKS